jgi:fimbrial chaperone protein
MPALVHSAGMIFFRVSSFLFVVGFAAPAWAGNYGVEPIRFELKTKARSQLLTVTSHAKDTLRIEVQPRAWEQNPDGTPKLTPTSALTVFPTLLTLKPGEVKRVRLAVKTAPKDRELTYRILLKELPPSTEKPQSMQFLVQMSVPIYHQPPQANLAAALTGVKVEKGKVSFVLENRGNVYYKGDVTARALDKAGALVYEYKGAGQVALAGVHRQLSFLLPKDKCDKIASLDLEFNGHGKKIAARLPALTQGACATP